MRTEELKSNYCGDSGDGDGQLTTQNSDQLVSHCSTLQKKI